MQILCQWSPGTLWSQLWALRQNHETGDLKGSRASRYLVISALVGFEIKWTCQGPKASSQLFCHRHWMLKLQCLQYFQFHGFSRPRSTRPRPKSELRSASRCWGRALSGSAFHSSCFSRKQAWQGTSGGQLIFAVKYERGLNSASFGDLI